MWIFEVYEEVSTDWVKPTINPMKTFPIIPLMSSYHGEICDSGEAESESQLSESQSLVLIVNASPFVMGFVTEWR